MVKQFIPEGFKVPPKLETSKFRLRMLTINDVDLDYDAVMSSVRYLEGVFGPDHRWPYPELSHEQDLIDLGWHQKEFQNRTSFAYTVMNLSETECLGCVYLYPTDKKSYDAMVILWVRESRKDLDKELYGAVVKWLNGEWPFKSPGFPGRDISWDEWKKAI